LAQRLILTINICCITSLFDHFLGMAKWSLLISSLFFYTHSVCSILTAQSYYCNAHRGFSSMYTLNKYSEYPLQAYIIYRHLDYFSVVWSVLFAKIGFYKNEYEFESLYLEKVGVHIRRTSRSSWRTLHCTKIYYSPGACP